MRLTDTERAWLLRAAARRRREAEDREDLEARLWVESSAGPVVRHRTTSRETAAFWAYVERKFASHVVRRFQRHVRER